MGTPTVFLSAASDDLKDWRDILHKAFERAGCKVFTQGQSLGASAGDVLRLLRQHLDKSDFVIHLAGIAYGAEPEQPAFAEHPAFQCSYTQFEYYYAHQQGKQVIAFVCAPDFPYLSFTEKAKDETDRERRRQLQVAHRDRVTKGRFTGTPLDGHPHRPLAEPIADVKSLLTAVAAAVGTIRDAAPTSAVAPILTAAQADLTKLIGESCPVDISRIIKYAPAELIGREAETKILNDAWSKVRRAESSRPHVLTFVALGGEGKTSLVAKWAAELAHQEWPGCDAVLAWSFYSQGTREQVAASSDLFLKEALTFFGDVEMANSAQGAFDKGRRLAQLVGERRALLILDGLEPLQYAPTSPTPGELKDQGLAALLKGLAANNHGLCVVTTRYSIPDLRVYWQTTAPETKLPRLSLAAGVELLQSLGVKGSLRPSDGPERVLTDGIRRHLNEFETLVEDVQGHALTLNLLGSYLRDAHAGDIRQRDLVKLEEADAEEQGGHAFRVMDAYVKSFESEGDKGKRALALLRLLGLFDRPATADCLAALLQAPAIPDLTEALVGMTEAQRNIAFTRLESAKLLMVSREPGSGVLIALDAHPLLREYFAKQLQKDASVSRAASAPGSAAPEVRGLMPPGSPGAVDNAWREGHRRLYEHLCATTKEGDQPTLEDLQPLYQAVAHGCHAGLQQEAYEKVYYARIMRLNEYYSVKKLGAFGSDLGVVACFFETPWSRISPALKRDNQAVLLNSAAAWLRALGRLTEALEPMRAGLAMRIKQEVWNGAAVSASNLSELELALGEVAAAVGNADQSVTYADRSGYAFGRSVFRVQHGNMLHQAGNPDAARKLFQEAEQMHADSQPAYPLLSSLQGFLYCDLLLMEAERGAWSEMIGTVRLLPSRDEPSSATERLDRSIALPKPPAALVNACHAVEQRAVKTIKIAEQNNWLLDIALDHLTLGRATVYAAILGRAELPIDRNLADAPQCIPTDKELATPRRELDAAVAGFRRSGSQHHLPRGLLTRAWLRLVDGKRTGSESAQSDLNEAWEIAERSSMKLFLADIHLYRARLFGVRNGERGVRSEGEDKYPWESPAADLAAAETLINACGYHRRDEELADAKAALL